MTLHIAFSATDSYVDYMGTTIFSIIRQHPQEEICFYVLSSWLSDHSRFKLRQLENDRMTISVIDIDQARFSHLPVKNNISLETYYRLLLPTLLPDLDRVLYLDCDILIKGSILPLLEVDLTGYYAAGVNERDMLYRNGDYRRSIGFENDETYINAGVTLFNLSAMRQDKIQEALFEEAEKWKDIITHQDQDILNLTLKGQIKAMPAIYNYTSYEREVDEIPLDDVAIVHYNWHKPWAHNLHVLQYNYETFALYQEAHLAYLKQVEPTISIVVSLKDCQADEVKTCLDSLVNQTYRNLDVVLLAPMGEIAELAQEYVLSDRRLRLTLSAEVSVTALYRAGIKESFGDYIALLEGSEWLDPAYLSNLYQSLVETGADTALSSFTLFNESTGIYSLFETDIKTGTVRPNQDVLETCLGLKWFEQYRHISLTGKLYRRSVFDRAGLLHEFYDEACWSLALFLASPQVSYGEVRQYVKRTRRIEETPNLAFVELAQTFQDWRILMTYFARKSFSTRHLNSYYMAQLDKLHHLALKQEELELCEVFEAEVNAYRALESWS